MPLLALSWLSCLFYHQKAKKGLLYKAYSSLLFLSGRHCHALNKLDALPVPDLLRNLLLKLERQLLKQLVNDVEAAPSLSCRAQVRGQSEGFSDWKLCLDRNHLAFLGHFKQLAPSVLDKL